MVTKVTKPPIKLHSFLRWHIYIFQQKSCSPFWYFFRLRVIFVFFYTYYGQQLTKTALPPSMMSFSRVVILSKLLRKLAKAKLGVGWFLGPHFPGEVWDSLHSPLNVDDSALWILYMFKQLLSSSVMEVMKPGCPGNVESGETSLSWLHPQSIGSSAR